MAIPSRPVAQSELHSVHNLFSDEEIQIIRDTISGFCRKVGQPHDDSIPPAQPFTLTLLESLRVHGKCCDAALAPALQA